MHAVPPDAGGLRIGASTVAGRLGGPSDEEGLDACEGGKETVLHEGENLDDTVPVRGPSGRALAVIGITISGTAGDDDAMLARAKDLATRVAGEIRTARLRQQTATRSGSPGSSDPGGCHGAQAGPRSARSSSPRGAARCRSTAGHGRGSAQKCRLRRTPPAESGVEVQPGGIAGRPRMRADGLRAARARPRVLAGPDARRYSHLSAPRERRGHPRRTTTWPR